MPVRSSTETVKLWLFPSLVTVLSAIIWHDVNEIKQDIKALMARSNIDKTRIDNLERSFYSRTTSWPDYTRRPIPDTVPRQPAMLPGDRQGRNLPLVVAY